MHVLQEEADHPWGGRVHETSRCAMGRHCGFQVRDILLQLALALRRHRPRALRTRILRRAALLCKAIKEGREQFQVSRSIARAVTGKAGIAVFHISRIADLRRFTITHDVDARRDLTGYDAEDRVRHARIEGGGVVGIATFPGEEKVNNVL
jgi:hypothetical protein